ncbi:hypothetical protein FDO65_09740 [Nakamurella flava]|uniref:Phospholipid carrier-dependent glycosyltransferase n=1 Tax=Nakamurella flava TaxID=2576308 RepID=A0A4U6QMI8_9ACTN|nr:hypothetical protein [Nakamurella flava]TKV61803.1 hypothetical protein FDO65_09740 [Nakamurella flava]
MTMTRPEDATAVRSADRRPAAWERLLSRWDARPVWVFAALTVLTGAMLLLNLHRSPDYLVDETYYTALGQHIVDENAISIGGGALTVHPPLYFMAIGAWEWLTGHSTAPILDALWANRYLGALLCTLAAVLTGITARELASRARPAVRMAAAIVATLLVASNGFLLAFGRTVLMEPGAIAIGAAFILTAIKLRHASRVTQVVVLGALIGTGVLVKATVAFIVLAPLVAALLQRERRAIVTQALAVLTGALVWTAFPLWAAVTGNGARFWDTQTLSIRRLFGLVHTTGVNLPSGNPVSQFLRTLPLYVSGYGAVLLGGIAGLVLIWRSGLLRKGLWRADPDSALLLGYGGLTYLFFSYSFLFGAGNQHLTAYAAAPAALLCVSLFSMRPVDGPVGEHPEVPAGRADGPRLVSRVVAGAVGLLLAVGIVGWGAFYAVQRDDGTTQMSQWISANVPACVPVNGTGSGFRWQVALPDREVTIGRDGPTTLARGVHLYLVSPKDTRYAYAPSSPALTAWIQANGTMIHETDSRSSESLQLWQVGQYPAPPQTSDCALSLRPPTGDASALAFLALFATTVVLAPALVGGATWLVGRRRRAGSSDEVGTRS